MPRAKGSTRHARRLSGACRRVLPLSSRPLGDGEAHAYGARTSQGFLGDYLVTSQKREDQEWQRKKAKGIR